MNRFTLHFSLEGFWTRIHNWHCQLQYFLQYYSVANSVDMESKGIDAEVRSDRALKFVNTVAEPAASIFKVQYTDGREVNVHPHNTRPKAIEVYTAHTKTYNGSVTTVSNIVRTWEP